MRTEKAGNPNPEEDVGGGGGPAEGAAA